MTRLRRTWLVAVLALSLFALSCGDNATTTTPTPTPTSPTTSSFASTLVVQGSVSRQFAATQAGTVSVTLKSAGAASTVVGLGLGVPTAGVARCGLNTATRTTAGTAPQITASVDAGPYCVAIYDVGTLTSPISFEISIVFP